MRLIHLVPAITNEASGPSYSVPRLCSSLAELGHDVQLAALDWEPLADPPPQLLAFPLGRGPRRLGASPQMRKWLEVSCSGGQVDVVHNHGMWQLNSLYPAYATARGATVFIQSPRGALSAWAMQHGSWIKRGFWPLLQRPALNRAHCFHATSEAEYQAIRELEFRQPVAIIPNGIDVHQLPPRTASPWRTLLFLGRLHVVKGIDTLLAAWGRVQPKFLDWRLVIVGSDDGYHGPSGYLADLKNYATQLGLQRVTFAGALFGAAKLQTLRDADLYVLPSRSENFAVSVAEALSMGTPAIVSTGAPWSGLEEKRAGWWIAPNVETLADCLCDAMACSPAELDAMGARGRSWMESDFSWASVAAQMAETYAWLRARVGPTPAWVRID